MLFRDLNSTYIVAELGVLTPVTTGYNLLPPHKGLKNLPRNKTRNKEEVYKRQWDPPKLWSIPTENYMALRARSYQSSLPSKYHLPHIVVYTPAKVSWNLPEY